MILNEYLLILQNMRILCGICESVMEMDKPYLTLAGSGEAEYDEKRSRFLSFASRVSTEKEAIEFISSVKSAYPDARHCVYAYTVSSSGTLLQRYSDDGEPQGTGGMPVLDVLRKKDITDAAIAVVRYFGGVLLGAPGLVRAYSSAASLAVSSAGIVRMTPMIPLSVRVSYQLWGKTENTAAQIGYMNDSPEYAEDVRCTFYIPPEEIDRAVTVFTDACAGKIEFEYGGAQFFPVAVKSCD